MKLTRFLKTRLNIPYAWLLLAPYACYAIGALLNILVLIVNHNVMPVLAPGGGCPDNVPDTIHACMTHASHLKFLADWIVWGDGVRSLDIMSPGDVFILAYEYTCNMFLYIWIALVVKDFTDSNWD